MSQIDKLNFLPHLIWFLILFGIFYFLVFCYILPLIYQSLEVRSLFYNSLLKDSLAFSTFFHFFVYFYNKNAFELLVKNIVLYFKQYKNIQILKTFFLTGRFTTSKIKYIFK